MVNFKEDEQLNTLNHSCAHLMAQSVNEQNAKAAAPHRYGGF